MLCHRFTQDITTSSSPDKQLQKYSRVPCAGTDMRILRALFCCPVLTTNFGALESALEKCNYTAVTEHFSSALFERTLRVRLLTICG